MANTWNQSGTTWGQNSYGLQTEVNISLTSLSLTSTVGSLDSAGSEQGWGSDAYGIENWGQSGSTTILTGLQLTASVGELSAYGEQGWGRDDWGTEPWGESFDPVVALPGFSLTTTLGEFPYAQSIEGWGRDAWGDNDWGENEITVSLTGFSLTASQPSVGWGNQVFGSDNEGWGGIYQLPVADVMGLTGFELETDLGTVTTKSDVSLSLTALSTIVASPGLLSTDDHSIGLTGFEIESDLGTATTTQLTIAALTGLDIESDLGDITISSNPIILPGSFTAQTSLGNVDVADVMGLTGLSSETTLGALTTTQLTIASLDGLGLTATTTLNDAINLQYFNRKVPKDSTGYSRKVPKNSTGYTRKVAN